MSNEKGFHIGWEQMHRDTRALAWSLSALNKEFTSLVAITRGGLVPTGIISRELGILVVETLGISSYKSYNEQSQLNIIKNIDEKFTVDGGKGVLVVDDLTDTGKTFQAVRQILPNAHYATVYIKPQGKPLVDNYVTEVSQDTWIYFPWDMALSYKEPINKNHLG